MKDIVYGFTNMQFIKINEFRKGKVIQLIYLNKVEEAQDNAQG